MSLFRVRDFWSFELDQLPNYYGSSTSKEQAEEIGKDGDLDSGGFIVSLGKFHSIGKHDVFVCAHLRGFICIIQVPDSKQAKSFVVDGQEEPTTTEFVRSSSSSNNNDNELAAQRQLLCASQLGLPIVDLKCGHFTSTLKQSIAVLSFDRLIVYQVKRRQVDLLTADQSGASNELLDESLFSHKLEEHHRIDLLKHELAANLTTLSSNTPQNAPEATSRSSSESADLTATTTTTTTTATRDTRNRNKQLQLPQRDLIVVQYQNQFMITLVDHKKVVGHFRLCSEDDLNHNESNEADKKEETHLEQLSQFMGPMPITYSKDSKGFGLIVSQSDNKVYCLQMSKLVAFAKQSVMKRVARDLIQYSEPSKRSSLAYDNQDVNASDNIITIDLASMTEWTLELAHAPIQMDSIQRTSEVSIAKEMPLSLSSELFIMSRYYINLFSSTGNHLWSQRFENPLICFYTYILPAPPPPSSAQPDILNQRAQGRERMLSLVCTDCLSADKCNLLVLDEERIAWSALFNTKPIQLWRTSLSKMSGVIAALDSNKAKISMSYLGTNQDSQGDQLQSEASESESELDQMSNLDDISTGLVDDEKVNDGELSYKRPLEVDICLEALNQWPDIRVNSRIKIRPEVNSSEVIQNIVATLEFDDLIDFQATDIQISTLSSGVIQANLGSCWPDRREPISFGGYFSMRSTCLDATSESMANTNELNQQVRDLNLVPKTLKVKIYLRFNILHSGPLIQEESFMLPLNMIARLAHIDYSCGQNQTLDDFMANLNLYKRQPSSYNLTSDTISSEIPYYLCDLFIKTNSDIIDIVDEIIESDLVCRGFNSETTNSSLHKPKNREEKVMTTLENINLLAQSLDCRLKYNNLAHSTTNMTTMRQSSEEYLPAIMMSIALKIPNGAHLIKGLPTTSIDVGHPFAIVWLHLCDLLPTNNSTLTREMVKLHMREWKVYEYEDNKCAGDFRVVNLDSDKPLMISIECDYPMPILFLQNHITERLRRRASIQSDYQFKLRTLTETMHDIIEINYNDIVKMDDFIAMSVNFHDLLLSLLRDYDKNLKNEFESFKNELDREYCKFHDSTSDSLSIAKRLINLPDSMHQQFSDLSSLTKQHQLNLNRILGELERLKRLDYQYSKVSGTSDIVIGVSQEGNFSNWPSFRQIID